MPTYRVLIDDTGEHYPCSGSRSLLEGMIALDRKGIPKGCRNGGCGVCKVAILSGDVVSGLMSQAHLSAHQRQDGWVLACRATPQSDIRLSVVGGMHKSLCRAGATALPAGVQTPVPAAGPEMPAALPTLRPAPPR